MVSRRSSAMNDGRNQNAHMGKPRQKRIIYRHSWPVRLLHWFNVVVITIMLTSGLQIFNAHPVLSWGATTDFEDPLLSFSAAMVNGEPVGYTHILGETFVTSGWLGMSYVHGNPVARAFPPWATLPSVQWLAMGRRWHFFFAWLFVANGLAYALYLLVSRRSRRKLVPNWHELKHLGGDVRDHLQLRFRANQKGRYNVVQKLAYLIVVFGLGPLIVITGLTMSPTIDAAFPWLLDIFGGRQSARTIHFLTAFAFVAFFVVHIVMVVLSGPINNLRSIITGGFAVKRTGDDDGRK